MSEAETARPESFVSSFFLEIRKRVRPEHFSTWFKNASLAEVTENDLVLSVESSFVRDWIQKKYMDVLMQSSLSVDGKARKIRVSSDPEKFVSEDIMKEDFNRDPEPAPPPPPVPARGRVMGTPLNPSLTFDNFVVGLSNNLPYAAARAVAENPGRAYNPLFIHGSVGLGKTHLLQAVCHEVLKNGTISRIRYISCEDFINQFISGIQGGSLESFRDQYRNTEMLLIDDIHLLAHKERTQEEFFHTFNHLVNAGRQVVFSSDSPPQEIPTLKERLVSRFKSGLVGEIEFPDLETRIAIVKRKARNRGTEFPNDVALFIAERVKTNIRELEGAVIEVIGYSTLNDGMPIDVELAARALKPILNTSPSSSTASMQDIFRCVQKAFGVTLTEIQSKRRTQTISTARHVAMYLARNYTTHSLQEIGGYMGGKDHASVLYAVRKVEQKAREDIRFKEVLQKVTADLLGGLL